MFLLKMNCLKAPSERALMDLGNVSCLTKSSSFGKTQQCNELTEV